MRGVIRSRPMLLAGLVFGLAACEPGVVSKGTGFQQNYSVARKALEAGNYESAIKSYTAMIPKAGPLQPRLRLEYAHALLRAGRFDEAASVARALAGQLKGSDKAAALAVQGTAEHEKALQAMDQGDYGVATRQSLERARAALDQMLKIDDDLDPLGSMESRRKDIRTELAQVQ